ncbi:uncharacterized protein LOC62_05G007488 [Vanrija pseudolonga]|uniref:Uncharacterized protein n=1 Tax=Vanrija pseudolonga TaxID=143232 RepID=A0AAF0YG26_9TREE|nr:hypothetical protein LOC62_05G007488 [Vanrija pseudolonga]
MSKAISFTYSLDPPASVPAASATHNGVPVPTSGGESFPITPAQSSRSATHAFYTDASAQLLAVQARVNEVLTAWKDAIGDAEKHKEATGKVAYGQGKAQRLMQANKADEAAADDDEEEEDEESDE